MDFISIKLLAEISALEAEMQGMIAENKDRELLGEPMAYDCDSFNEIAEQMNFAIKGAEEQIILENQAKSLF